MNRLETRDPSARESTAESHLEPAEPLELDACEFRIGRENGKDAVLGGSSDSMTLDVGSMSMLPIKKAFQRNSKCRRRLVSEPASRPIAHAGKRQKV